MNKYLIELLKLQSSVILPGFGSLMIGNSKTGKIVFNQHLKFNDGALAKFIAEKEGIDQQAAQNQIAKFVREIEAELGKGSSFDIFQFGKFSKDVKGDITFLQEGTPIAPVADTKKSESKVVKPAAPVEKKEIPVAKPVEDKEPVKAAEPVKEPVKAEVPKAETKPAEDKKETKIPEEKLKTAEALVEKKTADAEKIIEKKTESAEDIASKQIKNSFKPSDEKSSEKEIEKPKADEKSAEISKNIPLAEASKKDPAAQEKNVFKPVEEIKTQAVDKTIETKTEDKLVAAADSIKSELPDSKPVEKKPEPVQSKKEAEKPKKEVVKEKFKNDKPQKVKHDNPELKKPKKKKRWLVWFILLIIVGGGAAAGWMYKDKIEHFLFAGVGDESTDSTKTDTNHAKDTLQTEVVDELERVDTTLDETVTEEITEEVVEEPVEEVEEKPVVNNSSPGGTYHIIGNAFSSEANAEKYVKKMSEKGYSAQNIGKYNGLYLVSLKSFGSKEEAKNGLSSVKADAESAYVFTAK